MTSLCINAVFAERQEAINGLRTITVVNELVDNMKIEY